MTENGKAQIQALGAGLIGFMVVVGAGALLMIPRGQSAPKAPVSAYAAVDVSAGLSAPAASVRLPSSSGAPVGSAAAAASSPAPILPESEREAAPQAAAPAAAPESQAAAAPARRLAVTQHLDGSSSAHSSARAETAASAAKPAKAALAKKAFVAPKLDLSKGTQGALASVHYGVSNRAELMGRAAGPVYNFSGKSAAGQSQAADSQAPSTAGAMTQVEAAQQQIDSSGLDDASKAQLKDNLNQVRKVVSGTPQQ